MMVFKGLSFSAVWITTSNRFTKMCKINDGTLIYPAKLHNGDRYNATYQLLGESERVKYLLSGMKVGKVFRKIHLENTRKTCSKFWHCELHKQQDIARLHCAKNPTVSSGYRTRYYEKPGPQRPTARQYPPSTPERPAWHGCRLFRNKTKFSVKSSG